MIPYKEEKAYSYLHVLMCIYVFLTTQRDYFHNDFNIFLIRKVTYPKTLQYIFSRVFWAIENVNLQRKYATNEPQLLRFSAN